MTDPETSLAGIVAAAGASSRMGRPKQLIEIAGLPLVTAAVRKIAPHCDAGVVVVTGAEHETVGNALCNEPARVVYNPAWREGLSASIRQGVTAVGSPAAAVLVMLVDQPAISADDISQLVSAWRAYPERIAAACYDETVGVPAIFPAGFRAQLARLHGDAGARKILREAEELGEVAMASAGFDIDTPADLAALLKNNEPNPN